MNLDRVSNSDREQCHQDVGHQVRKLIAVSDHHNNRHVGGMQVLVMSNALVHGQQHFKPAADIRVSNSPFFLPYQPSCGAVRTT